MPGAEVVAVPFSKDDGELVLGPGAAELMAQREVDLLALLEHHGASGKPGVAFVITGASFVLRPDRATAIDHGAPELVDNAVQPVSVVALPDPVPSAAPASVVMEPAGSRDPRPEPWTRPPRSERREAW